MTTPSVASNTDSVAAPVAFSYAQAAKGKSAPATSSNPASASRTPPQQTDVSGNATVSNPTDRSNWSEDAITVVGDHDTMSNGAGSKLEAAASSLKSNDDQGIDANHEGSSVSTAHEESSSSTAQLQNDANWEHKSASSISNDTPNKPTGEGRRGSTKEKKVEKPTAEAMKEAPPPPMNVWTQRAQDLKAKQTTVPTKASQAHASNPSPSAAKSSTATTHSPPNEVFSDSVAVRTSNSKSQNATRHGEARNSVSGRSDRHARPAQPPTVNDTSAWPTPLSAQSVQVAEKKKTQEKADKVEADRPVAKAHGKNEWVTVPFTPSVKFETPLPGQGRRGGRPSGRGGRGGSPFAERASRAASGSEATDGQERGRENENSNSRSSSLPAKAKRPSTDGTISSDPSTGDAKQSSSKSDNTVQKSALASESKAKQLNGAAPTPDPLQTSSRDSKHASEAEAIVDTTFKKSDGHQTDAGSAADTTTRAPLQRLKNNGRLADGSHVAGSESEDRRKEDTSHYGGKNGANSRRNETARQAEAGREGSPPQRGGRSGRRGGRGGRSDYNTHANANGHANSVGPQSHSSKATANFPSQYAQQYASYLSNSRGGGYRNGGPRSASIPSGYVPAFGFPPPFDMDVNGMYGIGLASPTQQFPPNNVELMMLQNGVVTQLTYYFSLDNLLKDMYLRSHMDSQGFVSLGLIASFKRMASLTGDVAIIRNVCLQIPSLEVRAGHDGMDRVRVREGWDKWVLPMEDRKDSARHDGPPIERSHQQRSAVSPNSVPFSPDGYYPTPYNPVQTGYPPLSFAGPPNGFANGNKASNRHSVPGLGSEYYASTPYFVQNDAQNGPSDEGDSFPDTSIGQLTVVVRPHEEGTVPKPLDASSRTFSDGSLQGDQVAGTVEKEPPIDGTTERDEKIEELRRTLTKQSSASKFKTPDVALYWIKEKETPESMPPGTATEPYLHLHEKALHQRNSASKGETPHDMNVLYQFWSHFLIRNYNASMYNEFRTMAHEDASINETNIGMQNLIKYYGASLSSAHQIRLTVLSHYLDLVKNEDPGKDRPAFRQLRNAYRDGSLNMRNRKRLLDVVDPELRSELEG